MELKINLDLYIMAFERIDFIEEAILSALKQVTKNQKIKINLIISDNSISNAVEFFIKNKFPELQYIRRHGLNVIEHHNSIIKESSSDYLIMFHDDDVMESNFIESGINVLESDKNFSAFACNAYILNRSSKTKKKLVNISHDLIINDYMSLLDKYFLRGSIGHPPFSSYIYRNSFVHFDVMNFEAIGIHSDLALLISLVKQGKIYWSADCLINYRLHHNNQIFKISERVKIINYLRLQFNIEKDSKLILNYRKSYLIQYVKKFFSLYRIKRIFVICLIILLKHEKS